MYLKKWCEKPWTPQEIIGYPCILFQLNFENNLNNINNNLCGDWLAILYCVNTILIHIKEYVAISSMTIADIVLVNFDGCQVVIACPFIF